jgi:hypothetical protein
MSSTTEPTPTSSAPVAGKGLLADASDWLHLVRQQCQQQCQLLALETQLAAQSLAAMWLLTLLASTAVLGSWLLLQLLGWQLLQFFGWSDWQSLALLLVLQLGLLLFCLRAIRRQSQYLRFPATVASLKQLAAVAATGSQPDV